MCTMFLAESLESLIKFRFFYFLQREQRKPLRMTKNVRQVFYPRGASMSGGGGQEKANLKVQHALGPTGIKKMGTPLTLLCGSVKTVSLGVSVKATASAVIKLSVLQ